MSCDTDSFESWKDCILKPENKPENVEKICGVDAEIIKSAARLYAEGGRSDYYGSV